jgi:pimeloyl-ACP methyl ester carboxylesterase
VAPRWLRYADLRVFRTHCLHTSSTTGLAPHAWGTIQFSTSRVEIVLEERACEIGGVTVRYRVAGGAGPPALLVHGLGGSWRWWEPVVPALAEHMRVHLVDLPGFGSARGRRFVLADAPSYLRALVGAVGANRVTLIGHSLGGAVCARVAATWPALVDHLVLVAPAAVLERDRLSHYALPLAVALRHVRPRFLGMAAADSVRAGPRTMYRAGRQLLSDEALRGELSAIQAPTLLVWGERDPMVPPRLAEGYKSAISGAEVVLLPGVGHVPMSEQPHDFAAAVLDFVAR